VHLWRIFGAFAVHWWCFQALQIALHVCTIWQSSNKFTQADALETEAAVVG
jgi:hypothetical protein